MNELKNIEKYGPWETFIIGSPYKTPFEICVKRQRDHERIAFVATIAKGEDYYVVPFVWERLVKVADEVADALNVLDALEIGG